MYKYNNNDSINTELFSLYIVFEITLAETRHFFTRNVEKEHVRQFLTNRINQIV